MKREKQLTKRERKALSPSKPQPVKLPPEGQHIHCTACGRHLDRSEFAVPRSSATYLSCRHGRRFASCVVCSDATRAILAEHDRTGHDVTAALAWH
jgi:hypothetical protein